ncbi:hypothetical protein CROQUDRAFT_671993 [Cronartium quercuum f. sp. fusiforme G11]|uniref:Kinesin-like protein n=1 Tax=Cronartium quercuum f. sp. fusiforme G11 TaxID=708437 RepID=A0A9P6NGC6_9BASI|nr:hypothetical protein CROQUDRAFT_671993 [Cronartium quercuum f. sp. fusiforme G11]
MEGGTHTFLDPPADDSQAQKRPAAERETKSFAFDHSYWSACAKDEPGYASQQTLYEDLGVDLLDNSFQGYNSCIFAYGQTGSGKSYSMMGYGEDRGIIPLTCSALFDRIQEKEQTEPNVTYTVEVSFMEIYNERVRDLLNPKNKGNLRVREHPSLGPYVEDLSKLAVQSYANVETLMDEGNKARTVAATNMNETSSRSHSVFTLLLTQRRNDTTTGLAGEKVSRISLVDLAGSERANSTGATGVRLKEGAQINKSLTTLGKVISALATAGGGGGKKKKAEEHVPYRDSVLTWLLKDSLGGNSKTAMIAAISPADYDETLSTLRYADQAKKIKNKAVVNEDPNAKLIRELKEELSTLRTRISSGGGVGEDTYDVTLPPEKQIVTYQTKSGEIKTVTKAALQEQLEQSEKLMTEVAQTWEEKLVKTQVVQKEREAALEELGITIEKNNVGVYTPKKMPHLVNLNEDPLMSECLIYQIKAGTTMVGNTETDQPCDIRLSGRNILPQHCHFESDRETGKVLLYAHENAPTMVNGQRLSPDAPKKLKSGYRVILGDYHIFRFNHPEEVRKHREKVKSVSELSPANPNAPGEIVRSPLGLVPESDASQAESGSPYVRSDSPTASSVYDPHDYHYARREAVISRLNGTDVNLEELDDSEVERLFDDVARVRMQRKGTSVSGRESRMSYVSDQIDDDDFSGGSPSRRPQSGSTYVTDDTSIADSTVTFNQSHDRRLETIKADLVLQLDAQRIEYEDKIKTLSATHHFNGQDSEQLQMERNAMETEMQVLREEMQQKLEVQKQKYQKKVKKLKTRTRQTDNASDLDFDLDELTDEQRRLCQKAVKKWKQFNQVKLAERLLTNAVNLKESNVISKDLDKNVTYQFIVLDKEPWQLTNSMLESIKGLNEFDDVSDPALSDRSNRPCIGIKVLDKRHRAIYVWSLDKLMLRLKQMRNLYNFIDKPEFSQHFNWEDPFYDAFPPSYSFIGKAFIPLGPLYRNLPISCTLPIYSPYTLSQIASCRIRIRTIGIAPPTRTGILLNCANGTSTPSAKDSLCPLVDGGKITLEIVVDDVSGFTSRDFASVHCQIRTSSLVGPLKAGVEDHVFRSAAVDLPCDDHEFHLKQTTTITISAQVKAHFASACAPIEFFGQVMPSYLDRLERFDEKKSSDNKKAATGAAHLSALSSPNSDVGNPFSSPQPPMALMELVSTPSSSSQMRQPETEFVCEQFHDVSCSIQMLELAANGEYLPTPIVTQNVLDPGAFFVRQGLQRKLAIKVSHNSGRQFPWTRIGTVELSNVRLLDGQGRVHGPKMNKLVGVKPSNKPTAKFETDGTSSITYVGNWDTGAHDSTYLNRVTANEQRVLVELKWKVEAENCIEPISFKLDLGLTIKERDQRPPLTIFNFLGSSKTLDRSNYLFSIKLKPVLIKKVSEIWRLNTLHQFIHGEEALGHWKPRGISLLEEHWAFKEAIELKAAVTTMKTVLTYSNAGSSTAVARSSSVLSPATEEGGFESSLPVQDNLDLFKIGKSLELWQKQFGPKQKMILGQEPGRSINSAMNSPGGTSPSPDNGGGDNGQLLSPIALNQADHQQPATKSKRERKLTAEVSLIPRTDNVVKRGYMLVLRDPTSDQWAKRWFVLRRPYLYIYEDGDETREVGVINLGNVHVDSNLELECMLQRKNVFALYSSTNSYFFQTQSMKELQVWTTSIFPQSL